MTLNSHIRFQRHHQYVYIKFVLRLPSRDDHFRCLAFLSLRGHNHFHRFQLIFIAASVNVGWLISLFVYTQAMCTDSGYSYGEYNLLSPYDLHDHLLNNSILLLYIYDSY